MSSLFQLLQFPSPPHQLPTPLVPSLILSFIRFLRLYLPFPPSLPHPLLFSLAFVMFFIFYLTYLLFRRFSIYETTQVRRENNENKLNNQREEKNPIQTDTYIKL